MSGDLAAIFSRKIRAAAIGAAPVLQHIVASADECRALAELFGLPGIARLSGDFTLVTLKAHGKTAGIIEAELALAASLTQTCVISLEPFDIVLKDTATLRFVPAASLREDAEIADLGPESLEAPDEIPYAGEAIDLGAILAEQLALALDPYPRKPGAELRSDSNDAAGGVFEALAALRGKGQAPAK